MFIATAVIILITLVNILVYKLLQLQESNSGDNLSVSSSLPSEQHLCRRFSLAEILSATNKFDESYVIGRGGFGKVYKGVVDNGSTTIAIKRLNSLSKQGAPEFWTEIEMLSKFRHSHLVALIGYCNIYNEMILVYQYMAHGTLADHLHKIGRNGGDKSPLSWVQRLKICIGAARGLDYLHTGTGVKHRVIHRDVKSSNILLDENWAAKISDFGLSKIGPADQSCTHVSTYVKGTCGYMDPEYLLTRRLTRKSDVYSFGVVLFEVLCGRPAMDRILHEDQRGLARWAKHCIKEGTVDQIIDPNLRGQILPSCLSTFVEIAGKCLHNRPKKRPTMTEVAGWLEFALAFQERIDSSIVEEDIFNDNDPDDLQEHLNSSTKREVIDAGNSEHHDKKISEIKQLDGANSGVVGSLELALALQERRDSCVVEEEMFNSAGSGADNIVHHYEKRALDELKKLLQDAINKHEFTSPPISSIEETSKTEIKSLPVEVSIWGVPLLIDDRSDAILLKFLRAGDFELKDAFTMLKNTIRWRKQFGIEAFIDEDLGDDLKKVVFMHGFSKDGNPVCYNVYGEFQNKELYRKTFADEEKRMKFLRWRIQFLERSIRKLDFNPGGISTIFMVNDLKNSPGPGKEELRLATNIALQLIQDNYPEFVAKQVFLNVPWWYRAFYTMISPFLTQRTKSKFVFASPAKTAETLFKYIAPEQLPIQYGGLGVDCFDSNAEFTIDDPASDITIKPAAKHTGYRRT